MQAMATDLEKRKELAAALNSADAQLQGLMPGAVLKRELVAMWNRPFSDLDLLKRKHKLMVKMMSRYKESRDTGRMPEAIMLARVAKVWE